MKRALILALLSILWAFTADAQAPLTQSKLSPHLRMLVSGNPRLEAAARRTLVVRPAGPQRPLPAVEAFVKFAGDAASLRAAFAQYRATVRTVVGNLATAEIPIAELEHVASLGNVIRITESRLVKLDDDVSVPATGANQIWYGGDGPVPVGSTNRGAMPPPWNGNTGQGVLVGVVDTGIDLTHKDFMDASGNTRLISVWDQNAKGKAPATPDGFPAFTGNECTTAQINAIHQRIDLVVNNSYDETMSTLLGDGSGGVGSPNTFLKGHTAVAAAAADFDRDGNMDLITANTDGTMTWVQGNGNGAFTPQSPIDVANNAQVLITAIAAADLNGDGFPDVVAVFSNANSIAVMQGNGNGTFKAPGVTKTNTTSGFLTAGNSPTAVAIADLNADGAPDIVVTNYYSSNVSVFLNDGKGNFTEAFGSPFAVSNITPNYPSGAFPSGVVIGDFNGDGKPDLAIASWGRGGLAPGSNVSILIGNGDGTFGQLLTYSTGHFELAIAAGDFNRDGNLDLALESYSGEVTIMLGNGDGSFKSTTDYNAGGTAGLATGQATLVVGDFNQDGLLDVANLVRTSASTGSNSYYDSVGILLGNGNGTFSPAVTYPTGSPGNSSGLASGNFHSVVCTEVDLDGHGTQVSGIAVGNGSAGGGGALQTPYRYIGMAPQAGLIVVAAKLDGIDTAPVVDGVAYIVAKAKALGLPVVINLSLGYAIGPHDGTSDFDTMIGGLTGPGQIVVAAMGNEAEDALHADGTLAPGGTANIGFNVPANTPGTIDFDLWYPGQDFIGFSLTAPDGTTCIATIYPGYGNQVDTPECGQVSVSAFDVNDDNSDHEVFFEIDDGTNAYPSGDWNITLTGSGCAQAVCVVQGTFDLWESTPCEPACVPLTGNLVDAVKSIGEPATANNVIAVGSYVTKTSWPGLFPGNNSITQDASGTLGAISYFSSIGPRRTCSNSVCTAPVQKPNIVAPGEYIMSAYAANTETDACGTPNGACLDPDGQHIAYQGTSQATPHVTGAIALMLARYPNMTPCQVETNLQNARTDGNTGPVPNTTWGYGKLAIDLAIARQPVQNIAPNLQGHTLVEARSLLSIANLPVGSITYAASQSAPGVVFEQTPAPGAAWCGGVNLKISGVAVPDVSGDTTAQASTAISGANLTMGNWSAALSGTVPVDKVIQSSPAAGTYVAPASAVNLFISGVSVPDVTGQTKAAAQTTINSDNLFVGDVTFGRSQTVPVGSVVSEDPAPGAVVLPFSLVDLEVVGIPVPNIVGEALAAGESAITAASLTVGNVTASPSITVPTGSVVSETPPAGIYVGVGSAVAIAVSGVSAPNLAGQTLAAAETALTGAGLAVGNVAQAVSATVPAGQVNGQDPAAGSIVAPGSSVDMVVSSGASGQIKVPNVVGLSQAAATIAIGNAGLVAGTVTTASSNTVAAGNVIGEDPAAGTTVNAGSPVNLVVSTGASPPQSIAVTPANSSIVAGTMQQFTATGTYSGNVTQNITNQVTWASTATGVAAINGVGVAAAGSAGTVTISATLGSVSGSTMLTVAALVCSPSVTYTMPDLQATLNQALGISPPANDVSGAGVVGVSDVQIVVNAVLGLGCTK